MKGLDQFRQNYWGNNARAYKEKKKKEEERSHAEKLRDLIACAKQSATTFLVSMFNLGFKKTGVKKKRGRRKI